MELAFIVVPYDTALRGWRSGAGPEHLLRHGLVRHIEKQGHEVASTLIIEDLADTSPAEIRTAFELMRRVATAARAARAAGHFPVVLSGNCNVGAVGLLSALSPASRSIFWFDAHGESNSPDTTASGFLDGMGLSIALGWSWRSLSASVPGFAPVPAGATVLLGARDLDSAEGQLLADSAVSRLTTAEVPASLPALLARPSFAHTLGYLHLDLDVLDPELAGQANSHPVPGGLSLPQLVEAIRIIRSRVTLGGVTLASYAPEYDRDGRIQRAAFAALSACLDAGALTAA